MSPRLRPSVLRRRRAVHERGDRREELAPVVEVPRVQGSALREPSADDVYEGRLHQPAARPVGVNFLDVDEAVAVRTWAPADVPAREVQEWVPWCPVCLGEPIEVYTLGGAEYLARQHDAVHHGGSWTARAVLAGDVAVVLAAVRAARGVCEGGGAL